jgi:hypothetical protein
LIAAPNWPPLTRGLSAELTGGEKIVDNSCFSLPPALRATSLVRGRLWCTANLKECDKLEFIVQNKYSEFGKKCKIVENGKKDLPFSILWTIMNKRNERG